MQRPAQALAICRCAGDNTYYLFYCDEEWNVLNDTWHPGLESTMQQAEVEYEGVSKHWNAIN